MSIEISCSPVTCDTKISAEDAFKRLLVKDSNNCPAVRVIEVDAAGDTDCDPYIDCTNKEEGYRELFFKMIREDSNGCWALAVVITS